MDAILKGYAVNEPTWFYLSCLLVVAVFFRFSRLWSVRNFDLAMLLLITPGMLFVHQDVTPLGYAWLFCISAVWLLRLLFDSSLARRPRIDPNMNSAGLAFLCASAFLFLTTKVVNDPLPQATVQSVRMADRLLAGQAAETTAEPSQSSSGPVPSLLAAPVVLTSRALAGNTPAEAPKGDRIEEFAARCVAILSHLSVVLGLWAIGWRVYGDSTTGIAMSTLYMLHPCTAYDVQKIHHVLPSALILWSILSYRRPLVAGLGLGLACGTLFFPIFLLPLWAGFYGRKRILEFGTAVAATAFTVFLGLIFASGGAPGFVHQNLGYFDWGELQFRVVDSVPGFWNNFESAYRIPVIVSYLLMLVTLTFWPGRKNLGQLISRSAALVVGTQFWYTDQGGVYVLWYLPLILLVMFRPMLEHHALDVEESATPRASRSETALGNAGTGSGRISATRPGALFR